MYLPPACEFCSPGKQFPFVIQHLVFCRALLLSRLFTSRQPQIQTDRPAFMTMPCMSTECSTCLAIISACHVRLGPSTWQMLYDLEFASSWRLLYLKQHVVFQFSCFKPKGVCSLKCQSSNTARMAKTSRWIKSCQQPQPLLRLHLRRLPAISLRKPTRSSGAGVKERLPLNSCFGESFQALNKVIWPSLKPQIDSVT